LRSNGIAIVDEADAMISTANSLRLQKLIEARDGRRALST
jgi:hypothetical protein